MSRNRHKNKTTNNHPKPKMLIDEKSSYSPNSIGGRIDLSELRDKLFASSNQTTNHNTNDTKDSSKSLQSKGKA
jgi:hypothetical protein